MKIIGIIGGMSWESTQHYYQVMNRYVQEKLGGHHSMEAIVYSVDFERILKLVHQDDWPKVAEEVAKLAKKLQQAGAHLLILTSNAIHTIFPEVERTIEIPLLHIADPTGQAIQKKGFGKIGLLGTKVTMEELFYRQRLKERFGIDTIIPGKKEREQLHQIIFEELTLGILRDSSKQLLLAMIEQLKNRSAQGVILGCTELTLLIHQQDTPVPLFDTTALHAKAAVDLACSK